MCSSQLAALKRKGPWASTTFRFGRPQLHGDTSFHAIGTPIYVDAPEITRATKTRGFRRLMIAHDVGSTIKSSERGDIYFGSSDDAALRRSHETAGHFFVLPPQAQPSNVRSQPPTVKKPRGTAEGASL